MIETEAKIKITKEEISELIKKLGEPNFLIQENILYEISKGFVRIRKENGKTILTLKKSAKGSFNSRTEIEFEVNSSTEKLQEFFSSLGLSNPFFYKKERANFRLNNCVVSLDLLHTGEYYIEIEGDPIDIEKNLKELGLKGYPLETKSYFEILCKR
jgi:predicted adenylyl cyclase CyaB